MVEMKIRNGTVPTLTKTSMAKQSAPPSSSSSSFNALLSIDDLSKWELINHDEEDDDGILFEVQSLDSFSSETLEIDPLGLDLHESVLESLRDEIPKNGIDIKLNGSNSIWGKHHVLDDMPLDHGAKDDVFNESMSNGHLGVAGKQRFDANDDGYDDEEDEIGDGYDVDDDLVPWGVTDRLVRQRMRKLGKRSFARMTKSKRMAHMYTQPGCVRGKHGLGLKVY